MKRFYRDNFQYILLAVIIILMLYALRRQYIMDDAFISFRYSKNLIEGNGLVWNIGERVEGYSNFLWTMLVAGWMLIGVKPETSTLWMGMIFHLAGLIMTYLMASRLLKSRDWGLLVMILVGTNYTVSSMASSGLETPLQLLLFLLAGHLFVLGVENGWTNRRTLMLSVVLNIAMLTRPDSVILVAAAVIGYYYTKKDRHYTDFIRLAIPFALIFLPYLIWKTGYYGSLFPNSYHAKVRGLSGVLYGLFYIYLFSISYFLLPYFFMVIWRGKSLYRDYPVIGYLALFVSVWIIYVIGVGGDFMDFRFMIAVTPFIFIVILEVLKRYISDNRLRTALIIVLLLGTFHHTFAFKRIILGYGVEKVNELADHLVRPDQNWNAVGKRLNELFGGTDVVLGVGPAGAIPYYCNTTCIDLIGLTDAEIPKIAESFSVVPGHRIISPLDYLYHRGVNLVIQPVSLMIPTQEFPMWVGYARWSNIHHFFLDVDNPGKGRRIDEAILLGIPINDDYILITWYMTPSETVERVIREQNLRRIRLVRR
ncbi:MAG: hypothetical protein P9M15_05680 [Candidatus Electryoneaceae bacterium]|nr:hypothetical protein [Candidatus Electryoneaceae bacterium]